jgi:hypothetical protein
MKEKSYGKPYELSLRSASIAAFRHADKKIQRSNIRCVIFLNTVKRGPLRKDLTPDFMF